MRQSKLIEMDVVSQTKAAYGVKPGSLARRNGYRNQIWKTGAGLSNFASSSCAGAASSGTC